MGLKQFIWAKYIKCEAILPFQEKKIFSHDKVA
jgi:hypothetical protein